MAILEEAFFRVDYDLIPMFIHENYLDAYGNQHTFSSIKRMAESADCISFGDCIDQLILSTNDWGMLKEHSICSCYIPAVYSSGVLQHAEYPK